MFVLILFFYTFYGKFLFQSVFNAKTNNNKSQVQCPNVVLLDEVAPNLNLSELPIAYFNAQGQWLSNGVSTAIQVGRLAKLLAGKTSKEDKDYAIILIGVKNDEIVEWRVSPPLNTVVGPVMFNHKTGNGINKNEVVNEIQYDNRFLLFHFRNHFLKYFMSKEVQIIEPSQFLQFKFSSQNTVNLMSIYESQKNSSLIQFSVFYWNSLEAEFGNVTFPFNAKECKFWPFGSLVFRLFPMFRQENLAHQQTFEMPNSSVNLSIKLRDKRKRFQHDKPKLKSWRFCSKKLYEIPNNDVDVNYKMCILKVQPIVFDVDDLSKSERPLQINIVFQHNLKIVTLSITCALHYYDNLLNKFMSNNHVNIRVNISTKADTILLIAKQNEVFAALEKINNGGPFSDVELILQCSLGQQKELLPIGIKILFTNFSKFVSYFNATATPFLSANNVIVLNTFFVPTLPTQFEGIPSCIIGNKDLKNDNRLIKAQSGMNSQIVVCNLTFEEWSNNRFVWFLRSFELAKQTLKLQTPFELQSEVTQLFTAVHFKTAQFSNDLDSIIISINCETTKIVLSNISEPCSTFFSNLTIFGEGPKCSFKNFSKLEIELGEGAQLFFNDKISIKSVSVNGQMIKPLNFSQVLTVQPPLSATFPNARINSSLNYLTCDKNETVRFNIEVLSGSGKRELSCQWKIADIDSSEMLKMLGLTQKCSLKFLTNKLGYNKAKKKRHLTVSALVCNFAAQCTTTQSLSLALRRNATEFFVEILGIPITPLCSLRIALSARPILQICGGTNTAYVQSLLLTGVVYTWNINGLVVSHDSIFNIPSHTYECGEEILIELFAEYRDEDEGIKANSNNSISASTSQRIKYNLEPLATIVDGNERTIAIDETLKIDASHSWSPNQRSHLLSHKWQCKNLSSTSNYGDKPNLNPIITKVVDQIALLKAQKYLPSSIVSKKNDFYFAAGVLDMHPVVVESFVKVLPQSELPNQEVNANKTDVGFSMSRSVLPEAFSNMSDCELTLATHNLSIWTSPIFALPPNSLLPVNGEFWFFNTITDGKISDKILVKVHVRAPSVPVVRLVPLDNVGHLNSESFIRVQAFVCSKVGDLFVRWQLFNTENEKESSIDLSSLSRTRISQNFSLSKTLASDRIALSITIPPFNFSKTAQNLWLGLEANKCYKLRLTAVNGAGISFIDYSFCVHSPPFIDNVLVIPSKGIAALETTVRVQPARSLDAGFHQLRYGIRTILIGNESRVLWSRSTTVDFYETLLPSAWREPYEACGERTAFQALIELCDDWGACHVTESDKFEVRHATDPKSAINRAMIIVQSRIANGDIFKALELLDAVRQEQCNDSVNSLLADTVLSKILAEDILLNTQDLDELLEGLNYAMRIIDFASFRRLHEIMNLLDRVRDSLHFKNLGTLSFISKKESRINSTNTTQKLNMWRGKRNLNLLNVMNSNSSLITEATASSLLGAYDLLVSRQQDVVRVYLNNIADLISGFCIEANTMRILHASGKTYTEIQSQNLVVGDNDLINSHYSIAGSDVKIVSFNAEFLAFFSQWACADGNVSCLEICFGTAQTLLLALQDNSYLQTYFFTSQYSNVQLEKAVSNLYHLSFIDPINGQPQTLKSGAKMKINVPLLKYLPSEYYKCFMFSETIWEENACVSDDYVRLTSHSMPTRFHLTCLCHKQGILSVFAVNPPSPISYPAYNEIQLKFILSSNKKCTTLQLMTFIDYLTAASNIVAQRFVKTKCDIIHFFNLSKNTTETKYVILTILQPPYRMGQISNSYAMQSIKRTIGMDNGFTAYDNVKVVNMTNSVIYRRLNGDKNARRVSFRIDRSFKDVVGNDSTEFVTRWTTQIAENLRISKFRLKNPKILIGMLFNFTITTPFLGESKSDLNTILTAEEISKWIQEQVNYGVLELRDGHDQLLPIEPLTNADIVELHVTHVCSALMITLAVIISLVFLFISICIGGLVFVKIRTDRLIELHNSTLRTMDVTEIVPINVLPYGDEHAKQETIDNTDTNASNGFFIGNGEDQHKNVKALASHGFYEQQGAIRHRRNERQPATDNKAWDTVVFDRPINAS